MPGVRPAHRGTRQVGRKHVRGTDRHGHARGSTGTESYKIAAYASCSWGWMRPRSRTLRRWSRWSGRATVFGWRGIGSGLRRRGGCIDLDASVTEKLTAHDAVMATQTALVWASLREDHMSGDYGCHCG